MRLCLRVVISAQSAVSMRASSSRATKETQRLVLLSRSREYFCRIMGALAGLVGRAVAWARRRPAHVAVFYCYGFFLLGCAIASIGPALDELARRSGHDIKVRQAASGNVTGALTRSCSDRNLHSDTAIADRRSG
jgi:hypothetical protein